MSLASCTFLDGVEWGGGNLQVPSDSYMYTSTYSRPILMGTGSSYLSKSTDQHDSVHHDSHHCDVHHHDSHH